MKCFRMPLTMGLFIAVFIQTAAAATCFPERDLEEPSTAVVKERIARINEEIKYEKRWLLFEFGESNKRTRFHIECLKDYKQSLIDHYLR